MNLGIYIRTWLWGEKVGEDSFGNRYFQEKKHSHKKNQGIGYSIKVKQKLLKSPLYGMGGSIILLIPLL